jgi:tRNA nucleotidyltransferase (CCA-adding enzyme)
LKKILPEVDGLFGVPQPVHYHPEIDCGIHTMMVIDDTAKQNHSLEVRFSALTHDLGKATTPDEILPRHIGHEARSVGLLKVMSARLRVPADCRDLALLVARYHGDVHRARELRADTIVKLFDSCDLWRKPERFALIIQACESDAHGRTGHENDAYPQAQHLLRCARAAQAVNAGEIAKACEDKNLIADKVREARIMAVKEVIE